MNQRTALPIAAAILTAATHASAQASVRDEPARPPPGNIRAAAADHRSISLSDDSLAGPSADFVPEFHTVARGDTLWDISAGYLNDAYRWPQVWGLNPQITNPHWIFPGDQVRLREGSMAVSETPQPTTISAPSMQVHARIAGNTVFSLHESWLEGHDDGVGTIVGSPDDQMLLSTGDRAYIDFPNRTARPGETYSIFQEGQAARGADRNVGRVVRIIGTVQVDSWNNDRHIATVRVTEALDAIERGERVAVIPRNLMMIAPVRNTNDVQGHIVGSTHPRLIFGQNQVVFIDRGRDDHVAPGNRFFLVHRGDAWRDSLTISAERATGTGLDRDGDGNADQPPGHIESASHLPTEVTGEVLVLEVRDHSCTGMVTATIGEIEYGQRVEMRRNY